MTETLYPALPDDLDAAAQRVLARACTRGWTIATAESCTGGLLASILTDVEGCGHAFERGFVVYTDAAKCDLLHIARGTVDSCGAVSREVALAMAEGALAASKADVAVAITGFAGAAGPDDEPGLVHLACLASSRPPQHREEHFGNIGRGGVRIESLRVALTMLEEALA